MEIRNQAINTSQNISSSVIGPKEKGDDKNPGIVEIDILHLNDIHGAVEPFFDPNISREKLVGGLANVQTVLKEEKAKNPEGTLLVNAGDMTEGSFISNKTEGEATAAALAEMKFDVVGLGNHDFSWGTGALRNIVEEMDAPVVAANITGPEGSEIRGIVTPYVIKDIKGVKVGVIGLDTPYTLMHAPLDKMGGAEFKNPSETLRKYLPLMKEDGAELLVVLTHLGFEKDIELAKEFRDESLVIVGGHSHTFVDKGHKEGNSIIVQAGTQGKSVGKLELKWDPEKKRLESCNARLIPVIAGEMEPDPGVRKAIAPYLEKMEQMGANKVLGTVAEDIRYSHRAAEKINQIQADALFEGSGADFGLCMSSSLRKDLRKGPATLRNLFDCMPFEKWDVGMMKAKGEKILSVIEHNLESGDKIMIPSGLKYVFDSSKPDGQRLVSVTLSDGTPFDPEKEYNVIIDGTICRSRKFSDAKDKKIGGLLQDKFFKYFQDKCPADGWKNNPDDRVIDLAK